MRSTILATLVLGVFGLSVSYLAAEEKPVKKASVEKKEVVKKVQKKPVKAKESVLLTSTNSDVIVDTFMSLHEKGAGIVIHPERVGKEGFVQYKIKKGGGLLNLKLGKMALEKEARETELGWNIHTRIYTTKEDKKGYKTVLVYKALLRDTVKLQPHKTTYIATMYRMRHGIEVDYYKTFIGGWKRLSDK